MKCVISIGTNGTAVAPFLQIFGLLLAGIFAGANAFGDTASRGEANDKRIQAAYSRLPLAFEANLGQANPRVRYLCRGSGYTLFLTPNEAVLTLAPSKPRADSSSTWEKASHEPRAMGFPAFARLKSGRNDLQIAKDARRLVSVEANSAEQTQNAQTLSRASDSIHMKLVGANLNPAIQGEKKLRGQANYFLGSDPKRWRANVPTYEQVRYQNVYPGIDLVFYGHQRELEYDFVVAPGADPNQIRLQFAGLHKLEKDSRGDLILHAIGGQVRQPKPVIYQEVDGGRSLIEGQYTLLSRNTGTNPFSISEVGFQMADYDVAKPLIIDPVLFYSTYLGGRSDDRGRGVAVDAAGNAYVTGTTRSVDDPSTPSENEGFPTTPGAFKPTNTGIREDVFVTKLDPLGALVYSTYLGGVEDNEVAGGIVADLNGNACVTGGTASFDFPTTPGAYSSGTGGAFLTKLDPAGASLLYSTVFNPSGIATSIALDTNGKTYIAGYTGPQLPTTPDAFQATFRGAFDGFIAKFNPTASGTASLVYSTYLGGSRYEFLRGIAVDESGSAYVTGETSSVNFPTTPGSFQPSSRGDEWDAFVAKLDPTGSALAYSTYLGGGSFDVGAGVAVDSAGHCYVSGSTDSSDFPTTSAAFQTVHRGSSDAFVAKLHPSGSSLVYSTFLGGSKGDSGSAIAVDGSGSAYVTGPTTSDDFPTLRAFQRGGGGFITRLNPAGSGLVFSSYLASYSFDAASQRVAIDPNDNILVSGTAEANLQTARAVQPDHHGGVFDALVAKIIQFDCSVDRTILWPPNHLFVNVGLQISVTDPTPVVQIEVFSNEDDQEPINGESPSPDAKDFGAGTLQLRAERDDNGNGRTYLVVIRANDQVSGMGTFEYRTVVVPLDLEPASIEAVQAQAAAAKAFCENNNGALPPGYSRVGDGISMGSMSPTGSMLEPRAWHTATLLDNGKVLIAGGLGPQPPTSAELYDPATGAFAPAGEMVEPRFMHAAARLSDGRVLVVGGLRNGTENASSTEIYDPISNTFASGPDMLVPRFGHTAEPLPDGRILVAGGISRIPVLQFETLDSTEIYAFTGPLLTVVPGPVMSSRRAWHTSTLMPGGKVLIAGGAISGSTGPSTFAFNHTYLRSADLFDPARNSISPTIQGMLNARAYHTVTLISTGRVLISGGQNGIRTQVFADEDTLSASELYDPFEDTFLPTGSLRTPRAEHAAVALVDDSVLVSGGRDFADSRFEIRTSTELYYPLSGVYGPGPTLSARRSAHTATRLLDGRLLITGGHPGIDGNTSLDTAELYVP